MNLRYTNVEPEAKQEIIITIKVTISEVIKIDIDQVVETEEINIDRIGVGQDMDQIIGEKTLEVM